MIPEMILCPYTKSIYDSRDDVMFTHKSGCDSRDDVKCTHKIRL